MGTPQKGTPNLGKPPSSNRGGSLGEPGNLCLGSPYRPKAKGAKFPFSEMEKETGNNHVGDSLSSLNSLKQDFTGFRI